MAAAAAPHAASRGIALCFPSAFLKTMTCASPSERAFPLPAADVRAQLARILDTPSFLKAPILSRLLRHVVELTLAGATDTLKEYSLGVDVFDRGESFDVATELASGARLLVDVEFGRGHRLYALSQGEFGGGPAGSPALPDTGALLSVNHDGTLTALADRLNLPTSMEFIKDTAYVVTLTGEIWKIDGV
jgi:hypothetical protein